ncbi:UNVERIFIED_CONTAM: hypothetical protein FKN15_030842 [Acipenser sinensis]
MVIPGTTPTDEKLFNPPGELQKEAHIPDFNSYLRLYKKSIEEPEEFWKEVAEDFFWKSPPKGEFLKYNFDVTKGNVNVKFMEGAKTNICYNILDRNVNEKNRGEKVAYYWEGNSPSHSCSITYNQLLKQVCKFANVLKNMGKQNALTLTNGGCTDKRTNTTPWNADTNVWWDDVMKNSSEECEPEWVDAEDPLFILYTSGSTADSGGAKMNTRCPPKRVPSAARFFTLCRLTVQPPQSYSVGGHRSSGQLTGKPAGAWPDYRGRWCAGGHVITPLPAATPLKPGSAVFKQPWPAIMRTVYGNHERFENTYFKKFPGFYVTGDGCRRDKDGYYWITGRIDDMLNVSGHLLSTAEVESALTEHPVVAEAAVVSRPHAVKGECLYCFVTLKNGREFSHSLAEELKKQGKIMRRVLRQIARSEKDLGDLSTLADPKVVEVLFSQRWEATA